MIDIYIVDINSFDDLSGYNLITPKRQHQVDRYQNSDDKKRSLIAALLIRYCFKEKQFDVIQNQYGKLEIPSSKHKFNISHSGKYVVIAISDEEIGVDIEAIDEYSFPVAKRCYQQAELIILNQSQSKEETFAIIWTRKESVMKLFGLGFQMNPQSFFVSPIERKCFSIEEQSVFINSLIYDHHALSIATFGDSLYRVVTVSKDDLVKR